MARKSYKFTNRNFSYISIMSAILGIISFISVILAIVLAFLNGGVAGQNLGITGILAMIFSITGLVLGIRARLEKDMFYLYAYIGIVTNAIVIAGLTALIILSFF